MNYATERLLAAAKASLAAWQGPELFNNQRDDAMIEELESALFYFDAHGDKPQPQLVEAGEALAELLDDALTTHIYDEGNGDVIPADCPYAAALAAWETAKASPTQLAEQPAAPCYTPPEPLPGSHWRVRFFMHTTTCDRHSVVVRATDAKEAEARVAAWKRGEVELTDEEELTENLDKEMDIVGSEFSEIAQDEWHAPTPCDADGCEITEAA